MGQVFNRVLGWIAWIIVLIILGLIVKLFGTTSVVGVVHWFWETVVVGLWNVVVAIFHSFHHG